MHAEERKLAMRAIFLRSAGKAIVEGYDRKFAVGAGRLVHVIPGFEINTVLTPRLVGSMHCFVGAALLRSRFLRRSGHARHRCIWSLGCATCFDQLQRSSWLHNRRNTTALEPDLPIPRLWQARRNTDNGLARLSSTSSTTTFSGGDSPSSARAPSMIASSRASAPPSFSASAPPATANSSPPACSNSTSASPKKSSKTGSAERPCSADTSLGQHGAGR